MNTSELTKLEHARDYYRTGDFDKALPLLLNARKVFRRYPDIANMLGTIYFDSAELDQAQACFEEALELNPHYTEAALNLVVTYNEQGFYDKARQLHEQAVSSRKGAHLEIEPSALGQISNQHAQLGRAYAELHMLDRAIEQYRAALRLNPDYVDIRTRFGQLLRDAGELNEAVVQFKTVLEIRNDYVPAMISLGTTHFAQGDKCAARDQWKAAVTADPDNRAARMYLRMVENMLEKESSETSR